MTVLGGLQFVQNLDEKADADEVSIPMTVLGGLQCLLVRMDAAYSISFNTDDGIRRAAILRTSG